MTHQPPFRGSPSSSSQWSLLSKGASCHPVITSSRNSKRCKLTTMLLLGTNTLWATTHFPSTETSSHFIIPCLLPNIFESGIVIIMRFCSSLWNKGSINKYPYVIETTNCFSLFIFKKKRKPELKKTVVTVVFVEWSVHVGESDISKKRSDWF